MLQSVGEGGDVWDTGHNGTILFRLFVMSRIYLVFLGIPSSIHINFEIVLFIGK